MKRRYICTETMTGILSAVYDAWKADRTDNECGIVFWKNVQQEMFCRYFEVREDEKKANSVRKMIWKYMGEEAYLAIGKALLSDDREKGTAVLHVMLEARKLSDAYQIMGHLSHPAVRKVFELSRNVDREMHAWKGFLRFQEMEKGFLYAEFSPKNMVLPGIADHFADRFPMEDFVIYDNTHSSFLLHPRKKQWLIVTDEEKKWEIPGAYSEKEKEWQRLWKTFNESATIRERENRKLQQINMPLRYRKKMTEMQQNAERKMEDFAV